MKRFAVALAAVPLVLFAAGCPQTGAGGSDGGGTVTDGGTTGGTDGGPVADAGTPDAGCGGLVAPSQASCCTSCSGDVNGCQANGCYGGWWCDPSACACAPAPAGCTAPPPPADGGTPDAGPPPPVDAGTPDAGPPVDGGYCNGLAVPNTPSCCHSCSSGSGTCQPNGCYGGWMCNPSSCYCKSPPATCTTGATDGGTPDAGPPPTDGGPAPGCTTAGSWPAETGPLACSSPGCYLNSQQGSDPCGKWCWSTKTGTDSDKGSIDLSQVVQTTIAQMDALQGPPYLLTCGASGGYCSCPYPPRESPAGDTVYELKNVHVSEIGLEADSDYHMDLDDGQGHDMVAEIPFPGCVGSSSVVGCNISHARAAVDAVTPPQSAGDAVNLTATIIGVGFFDFVHNPPVQGSAANGVELHPVLRMCFGLDCDPLAAP